MVLEQGTEELENDVADIVAENFERSSTAESIID